MIDDKYFGIVKWYNKQKEFGVIQGYEIGDAGFKPINLAADTEITSIPPNTLVHFSVRKNHNNRFIAEDITINFLQFVQSNYKNFDKELVNFLFNYANEENKKELQQVLQKKKGAKLQNIKDETEDKEITDLDLLKNILSGNDISFAVNLIKNLVTGLGKIKSDKNYQTAIQLLSYNQTDKNIENQYLPELPILIYQKSNNQYKFQLWMDGHISFCNLDIIKKKFEKADNDLKLKILGRCNGDDYGFLVYDTKKIQENNQKSGFEDIYFNGIRDIILSEINKAKESIFVAVAWFTNHHFLDALCEKVKQGVRVELIILNDYINNSIGGLEFQKFIDLGKKNGNSAFYLCGVDNIMHHKFCIIDRNTVFNGSYNWTYYAESRNYENCMIFQDKPHLTKKFIAEFERLKSLLESIEKIIPLEQESLDIFDLFSFKQYRSKDYEYQAKEARKANKISLAYKLILLSLELNPQNKTALRFQQEISEVDEKDIRNIAIEEELLEKRRLQKQVEEQIAEQKRLETLRLEQEKERKERESKEKSEELKRQKEELKNQEKEKKRLQKQEEKLRAKKKLEEQEKQKLAEIEEQKKLFKRKQEQEKLEREKKQREVEEKRIKEQQRLEEEKKRQAEIIATKEAEKQRLVEEQELLEKSKDTSLQGNRGKLRINLEWKTLDDLDLHVFDPDNNHISYQKKEATCQGSLGELDVDANAGDPKTKAPQENIFWDKEAPEGTYKVEVNHYSKNEMDNVPFIITITPEIGQTKVFTGKVIGEKDTVTVATFTYNSKEGLKILSSI